MEYIFIVNPKSRSGMGEMTWRKLEPELKKKKVIYRVYLTQRAGHACDIAGRVTADNENIPWSSWAETEPSMKYSMESGM